MSVFRLGRYLILLQFLWLTGCMPWLRAYQVYLQLNEFEQNFFVEQSDGFVLNFKHPVMYDQDFIDLSGLHPSARNSNVIGESWRYRFVKVDDRQQPVVPEVAFSIDLQFNRYQRLSRFRLSSLFLKMAPSVFLDASIRALAGAEIDQTGKKLKASADGQIQMTDEQLPTILSITQALGEPAQVLPMADGKQRYDYFFLMRTQQIKPGYENRALSEVKLTFDRNDRLIKMSGRFAGLKLAINYLKFLADS